MELGCGFALAPSLRPAEPGICVCPEVYQLRLRRLVGPGAGFALSPPPRLTGCRTGAWRQPPSGSRLWAITPDCPTVDDHGHLTGTLAECDLVAGLRWRPCSVSLTPTLAVYLPTGAVRDRLADGSWLRVCGCAFAPTHRPLAGCLLTTPTRDLVRVCACAPAPSHRRRPALNTAA